MLSAIRKFFDQRIAERPDETTAIARDRTRVAAAALLVEVVRADQDISADEREAALGAVQRKFGLEAEAAQQLLALADAEAREAHDTYQFTAKINASFSPEQKLRLIEELWRLAYADAALHSQEEHLIRRVAELLHVSHTAFILAKLRVQESLAI
ncbi:MAG: TerB family tellurite resistance protein [Steroidobacteraceae bacterium]